MIITDNRAYEDSSDVLLGLTTFFLKYQDTLNSKEQSALRLLINNLALVIVKYEKTHLN